MDANDVEFVLAPPRGGHSIQPKGRSGTIKPHILGEHVVWILDFHCCKHMPLDEIGVEQAVVAFYKNDAFYPRPERDDVKDLKLWNECTDRFLEMSEAYWIKEAQKLVCLHSWYTWLSKVVNLDVS